MRSRRLLGVPEPLVASAAGVLLLTRAHFASVIDSGLVGSTDFHSSHPQWHEPEHHAFSGRGAARAEDAQGTPTQSHISPSILVYED